MNIAVQAALLALGYFVLALAGIQLSSLSATDAFPLWPAAGLAVGAIIVRGPRLWPGVFAGAVAFNVLSPNGAEGLTALVAGLVNGTGATLQALLAAHLTRPLLARRAPLVETRNLLLFLLCAGPLACVVSASVAVPGLTALGRMPAEALGWNWLTWWVGDTVGVFLVAPILVMLLPAFGASRKRLAAQVGASLLVVAALLVASALLFDRGREAGVRAAFAERAARLVDAVEHRIAQEADLLQGVERLFAASDRVTRAEFGRFTASISRRPSVRAVAWLPRVGREQRAAFEAGARTHLGDDYRITEEGPDGTAVAAGDRPEYFPALYVAPFPRESALLGYDYAGDERLRDALARARDTGRLVALEFARPLRAEPDLVLLLPVYETADRGPAPPPGNDARLRGYVLGALSVGSVFEPLLEEAVSYGLGLRISDAGGTAPGRVLAGIGPAEASPGISREIDFAGRTLRVEIHSTARWNPAASALDWFLLLSSLLAAFLVALATMIAATRQVATAVKVEERTTALTRELEARRAAEEALRESEAFNRSIVDASPDCLKILSLDGELLYMSPAGRRLMGVDDFDTVKGTDWVDYLSVADQPAVRHALAEARMGRETRFEAVTPTFSGGEKWWDVMVTGIMGVRGKPDRLLAVSRDISHQKRLEEKLRGFNTELERHVTERTAALAESERRHRTLLANLAGMAYRCRSGADRAIEFASDGSAELFGLTPEDLTSGRHSPEKLMHPDDLPGVRAAVDAALESGSAADHQYRIRLADGRTKWVWETCRGVYRDDGSLEAIEGFITDVTEQKQVEAKLRETEETLRLFIENAPAAIAMFDREMRYLAVSRRWMTDFDLGDDGVIGRCHYDVFPDLPDCWKEADRRGQAGEILRADEDLWERADGSMVWLRWEVRPWRDTAGAIGGIIIFCEDITARKKTVEALKREQEFRRALLENATDGVVACDAHGTLVLFNRAAREWHGKDALATPPEEWGRDYDLYGSDGSTPLETDEIPLARAFAGETIHDASMAIAVKGHPPRHILASGGPFFDESGRKLGAMVLMRDVTERKQTEDILRLLSVEAAGLDSDSFLRLCVQRAAETLGVDIALVARVPADRPDQAQTLAVWADGRMAENISYPLHGTPCENVIGKECCVYPSDVQRRFPDDGLLGEMGVAAYAGIPLFDRARNPLGLLGVMSRRPFADADRVESLLRLMAVRMSAELERRRDEKRFVDLFEFAPDAILMVDTTGRITLANRQTENLFGYARDELVGEPVEILLPEAARHGHVAMREKYFSAPVPRTMAGGKADLEGRRKDGTVFPVGISLSPIEAEGGKLVVAAVRDVSDRLRQEEDRLARAVAEQASRAKSSFLAAMSHEIRTPMNAVLGLSEVLAHHELTAHQAELVGTLRDSAGHLLRLIDGILDFSKVDAGRVELEREPVAVADLVESVSRTLASLAAKNQVALHLFVSPDLPARVLGDELRLRQIIYNLVGNAVKFSGRRPGRRGHVEVRVEMVPDSVLRLTVSDNGIGMSSEVMDRLFTPFAQGESSTTRRFGGTGLGLTISKRLVDLMGGEIDVASTPEEGSTFTVRLPMELEAQPGTVASDCELRGLHCVLFEGDTYRADDLQTYLEHAGARVLRVYDDTVPEASDDTVMIADAGSPPTPGSTATPRQVLIGSGRRRRARLVGSHTVSIDAEALRYTDLVRAVAVAAGRASPVTGPAEPMRAIAAPVDVAGARAAGRLILVAEDDAVNQKVVLQQLALLGYAAEVANDGGEALALWRKGGYALLLADLHMPEMDGYALTRAIRSEEAAIANAHGGTPRLPILALTANALHGEASHARAAGMDDFLTKPIALKNLRAVLEQWLGPAADRGATCLAGRRDEAGTEGFAFDASVLDRLVGDDPQLRREILGDYLEVAQELAAEIGHAAAQGDGARVGALAHRLKSSSRSVGALALGDLCAELENAGKRGDRTQLGTRMREFESLHADVTGKVQDLLGSVYQ